MDQIKFSSIALSDELKRAVEDMGYDEATLIQSQSIPLILEGHDIIGKSQTGSGKTAAFGLPAIELIDGEANTNTVQVLILCPTRELALQITNEIKKYSKYISGINCVPVYGGEPISLQIKRLKLGCQIVVGTPGRIMDHMRRKTIKLDNIKMAVLDEADEMLNMGFVDDIVTILSQTPSDRQTVLFSATMPPAVLEITKKFQKDPHMIEIKQTQMTVSTIDQFYFSVPKGQKTAALIRLLEYYKPESSIVFCNTKKMVDELILDLKKHGYHAQGLHGDMRQSARTQVMHQFRSGQFDILAATDVAARGIDINDIKIVINYDLPMEDEYYVHRIGRTGRAGKSGQAFTLITDNRQLAQLKNIIRYTKGEIIKKSLPTISELKALQTDELCSKILSFIEENNFKDYQPVVDKLMSETLTEKDIAAALIAMNIKQNVLFEEFPADFKEFDINVDMSSKSKSVQHKNERFSRSSNRKNEFSNENMSVVRISIGRKEKIAPNHILGAIAGETGLPGRVFGAISIFDTYTLVEVPKEFKKIVLQRLNNKKINGRIVSVESR